MAHASFRGMPMDWYSLLPYVIGYVLTFVLIPVALLQRKPAVSTLAWMLAIVFMPYVGAVLFLVFGARRIPRKVRKKRRSDRGLAPGLGGLDDALEPFNVMQHLADIHLHHHDVMALAARIGKSPPLQANQVDLMVDVNETYDLMEQALRDARHHAHLEFYVWQPDETGRRFRDVLVDRAREGVEVRLLLDSFGSLNLDDEFLAPLEDAGVQVGWFLPIRLLLPGRRLNLRNHRKIIVVDGHVGFTGGVNIGDEYTGKLARWGPWRDTHLRLHGPVVHQLQQVFAEDWFFTTDEDLARREYFPTPEPAGDHVAQIIASGPTRQVDVIHDIFFAAIAGARERVLITTPYFVPSEAIATALTTTARRGVDVRLLLPRKSNQRLVLHAGRSYYEELLEAGIAIYEYTSGMLHAKVTVVDGRWAVVGSANMDTRSFRLNFEMDTIVYGSSVASHLEKVFHEDLNKAVRIRLAEFRHRRLGRRLVEATARLLSPVL